MRRRHWRLLVFILGLTVVIYQIYPEGSGSRKVKDERKHERPQKDLRAKNERWNSKPTIQQSHENIDGKFVDKYNRKFKMVIPGRRIRQNINKSRRRKRKVIHTSEQKQLNKESKLHRKANNTNKMTFAIILSYIRSGSSFTGDIIQQDPSTFYVFEPLRHTEFLQTEQLSVRLLDGTYERIDGNNFVKRASSILHSLMTCNLRKLDFGTLSDDFMIRGHKTKKYKECYLSRMQKIKDTGEPVTWCMRRLSQLCVDSKVRIIKTIRLNMTFLESMMAQYDNLKVIHLIRDPRAQIYSIDKVLNSTFSNGRDSKMKCRQMSEDFLLSLRIRRRFPDRFLRLYYEDLATEPIRQTRSLYNFLNLKFTEDIMNYVYNITHANTDGCTTCTDRKDSSSHVIEWRRRLTFNEVKLIDSNCMETYKQYGYLPVQSEDDLRNLNLSFHYQKHFH